MTLNSSSEVKNNPAPWGAERRLEFIDFRLRWERTVNRSDLIDFFRISPQQASADLARYTELAPGNLEYDKSLKTYRVTGNFKPAASKCEAQSYLEEIAALTSGQLSPAASFIGWRPACDIVRYPVRPIATLTLLQLLWSMRDNEELLVAYQSMRRPAPSLRWIAPHALASDGQRWHVRAWCVENSDFRDFVISRIQSIEGRRKASVSRDSDQAWNSYMDVVIKPRSGLTEGQSYAIESDFGMSQGRLKLSCRKALVFYLLRQLQLDRLPDQPPVVQPLELVNRVELADLIAAAQKIPTHLPLTPLDEQELHHDRA
jgi:hypothetical protein